MVKLKMLIFFFLIEVKVFYVGYEMDVMRGVVIFYLEFFCLIIIWFFFFGVELILVKYD